MAKTRPAKPSRTPLQEASDPSTDPEQLRKLSYYGDDEVERAVWRNPSVPEDAWRNAVLEGSPEAWSNPMALIYLLTWTPREGDLRPLNDAARWVMPVLWEDPERCSTEGKALIAPKVQEWWVTSQAAEEMIRFLGWWAYDKGKDSPEHLEVLRIILLCLRTIPDLHGDDQQVLDLLQSWIAGGADQRKKAEGLAFSWTVKYVCRFARDPSSDPAYAIFEILKVAAYGKKDSDGEEVRVQHSRHLADLIRQARPLPPM